MTESELLAENERLTAVNHRLSTHLIGMSDTLQASAREIAAKAWDEGFKQGGPMHDVNYDDPGAHTRNPYRQPRETLGGAE